MNETINTIISRKSTRAFKPDQIKDNDLQVILDAGRFAPSGGNTQPWLFTVVQNPALLKKINRMAKEMAKKSDNPKMKENAMKEGFCVFYNAPTLIIVSGDKKAITPVMEYDCVIALSYLLLGAESVKVDSCWIHAVKMLLSAPEGKELRIELKIPENNLVIGTGAFGFGVSASQRPPRKEGTVIYLK